MSIIDLQIASLPLGTARGSVLNLSKDGMYPFKADIRPGYTDLLHAKVRRVEGALADGDSA